MVHLQLKKKKSNESICLFCANALTIQEIPVNTKMGTRRMAISFQYLRYISQRLSKRLSLAWRVLNRSANGHSKHFCESARKPLSNFSRLWIKPSDLSCNTFFASFLWAMVVSVLKTKCIFVFSLTKDQNPISTIWAASLWICTLCRYGLQTQTTKILLQQQTVTGILIQESFEIKRNWISPSLRFVE